MDALIFKIIIFVILFAIGWGFGRHTEKKHLDALAEQEQRLAYITLDNSRFLKPQRMQDIWLAAMWWFHMTTLNMSWPIFKTFSVVV